MTNSQGWQTPKVVVGQVGAREHYAPAAMLAQNGSLEMLLTDLWNPVAVNLPPWIVDHVPGLVAAFWARHRSDIPSTKVQSFWFRSLVWRFTQASAQGRSAKYSSWVKTDREFAKALIPFLDKVDHDIFFGYSGASLEAIQHERDNGKRTILDQTDLARKGERILVEEESRHQELSLGSEQAPEYFFERREKEWSEADVVMVNSAWCRDAMIEQGVPRKKIRIVPLCFTPKIDVQRPKRQRVLRVLWLGNLTLLKGLAYALEAAHLLLNHSVEFTFAGQLSVRPSGLRFPPNARYVGKIPRSYVSRMYINHDVFLLPTLSDGFAITQVEAMAYGLPVITTQNCGDVVEHGMSGFLIPAYSPEAIRDSIVALLDRELLDSMSIAARKRAKDFSPERIGPQFLKAVFDCI